MEKISPRKQLMIAHVLAMSLLVMSWPSLLAQTIFLGTTPSQPATCNCLNNATTLSDGQFSEQISIAGPVGATWTVSAVTGFFQSNSPAPPAAPLPVAVGTVFSEISPGVYRLSGRHVSAQGFSLSASNGTTTLTISNRCYYPNVQFVGLPDTICISSLPVILTASAGGAQGSGSFSINGAPATIFNPLSLGSGVHTVTYSFDAGTATPNNASDPGCSIQISKTVVVPHQPSTAVNSQINVTLDADCQALITPEMVMEGYYPCLEDFVVTVYNNQGQPIGNLVTEYYVGQTLNLQVISVNGSLVGTGSIRIFDTTPPDLTCVSLTNMAIVGNQVQLISGHLTTNMPTFLPSNFACYSNSVGPLSGIHYYHLQQFTVTTTDIYTFELSSAYAGGGAFGLYQTTFNPFAGPCHNIVGSSQQAPPLEGYFANAASPVVRFSALLMAGSTYTLLTTSREANRTGGYQYAVYSNGSGQISGISPHQVQLALPVYCNSTDAFVNNVQSLPWTGTPLVADGCLPNPQVTFTDQVTHGGLCGTARIVRTFTALDQSNNMAQCTQEIVLPPIKIENVSMPPKTLILPCDGSYQQLSSGNPHPSVTGYPLIITAFGVHEINGVYGNMLASYTDQARVNTCEGSYQFIRRWVIYDNCQTGVVTTYDQIIRIADLRAPEIHCSAPDANLDGLPDTLRYSTTASMCAATISVPMASVTDNCSSFGVVTEVITQELRPVLNPFGVTIGYDTVIQILATIPSNATSRIVTGIPAGRHWFRYRATDHCGNVASETCPFVVTDTSPPTAICDDLVQVSLGGNGIGVLRAIDIDEGSTDNCGELQMEVRRMVGYNPATCQEVPAELTDWASAVTFSCCEVGQTIPVQLRVSDPGGNRNMCATQVVVLDYVAPVCVAPAPVFVACNALPTLFVADSMPQLQALFGMAEVLDDCSGAIVQELSPVIDRDECGTGTIKRIFKGEDGAGNESEPCEQIITFTGSTHYEIKFPRDVVGDCAAIAADTLITRNYGCDMVAVSHVDQRYDIPEAGGVCFKIFRTYSVINWCEYDGISDPYIVSRDPDCNGHAGETDVWVLRRPNEVTYLDRDNNQSNNLPLAGSRGISCGGATNPTGYWQILPNRGYWKYTQVIKVMDLVGPQILLDEALPFCTQDNQSCNALVTLPFVVVDDCASNPPVITVELDLDANGVYDGIVSSQVLQGSFPNYQLRGSYPVGSHRFRIRVRDYCGNTTQTLVDFEVIDCTLPTTFCAAGLTANLVSLPPGTDADGDGIFDLSAAFVNIGSYVNTNPFDCSGALRYSVFRTADIMSGEVIPTPTQQTLAVTCADLGVLPVRIYTWDAANNPHAEQPNGTVGGPNYGYCDASIFVTDQSGLCLGLPPDNPVTGEITGLVVTEGGQPLAGVEVYPTAAMSPQQMTVTPATGLYELAATLNQAYQITPRCNLDWSNGVSTLDIVMTAKHILGIQYLTSPYRIIAADVNRSQSVTTLDLVHMRRMILGDAATFPNNTSWRFVDQDYSFPNSSNPFAQAFPEVIDIPAFSSNITDGHFIAIKVGDVNGSAIANAQDGIEERTAEEVFYLQTDEQYFKRGDKVEVTISQAEAAAIVEGLQFTLQFDPSLLSLHDINWGKLQEEHLSSRKANDGILTVSWNAGQGVAQGTGDKPWITLVFRANQAGRLSEVMGITSRVTKAEAYDETLNTLSLGLAFIPEEENQHTFVLEQNRPNPFGDQTVIGFFLPESSEVTFTIYDTHGKVVMQYNRYYVAGYNQILVDAADVTARGMLYYQLATGKYTDTKKMVILE